MQAAVGENILLVGTAHVSQTSVDDVKAAIASFRPDVVAVELDERRHKAITQKRDWEATPVTRLLQGNTIYFFLAQTFLAAYQRRMGQTEGVEPGAEMIAALDAGAASGATVVLADRDIGTTFKRAFAAMGFVERLRITWELLKAMVGLDKEKDSPEKVDDLLDQDVLSTMMEELGSFAPSIKTVLIDERDLYLATKIRDASADGSRRVVAVVGAGHLAGVQRQLADPQPVSLELLETVPEKRVKWGKILGWALPLIIVGVFAYLGYQGYQKGNYQALLDAVVAWVLITGTCSALGALAGGGHILSILTAFVAAPLTTLHPALAAGWFAGLAEAWVRRPQVKDFNGLAHIATVGDFYRNHVTRIILVAAFCNLGSTVGFFIASGKLLQGVF